MSEYVLHIDSATKRFGGLLALNEVSLEVAPKTIHAVIGPNGSGKTTLFNVITSVYALTSGSVLLGGHDISGLPPHSIAKAGIARTFQNLQIFDEMTLLDNVVVGLQCGMRYSVFENLLKVVEKRRENKAMREEALGLLDFFGLADKHGEKARNLPYGQMKLLEIARALGAHPKVLLLDEPAAGMNPRETLEVTRLVREIKDKLDITIIIVEHNIQMVMSLAETISVLDHGIKIAEGPPEQVQNDPKVIEAYLGVPPEMNL